MALSGEESHSLEVSAGLSLDEADAVDASVGSARALLLPPCKLCLTSTLGCNEEARPTIATSWGNRGHEGLRGSSICPETAD